MRQGTILPVTTDISGPPRIGACSRKRATWKYGHSVEAQEMSVTESLGRSRRGLFTGTARHYALFRPGYPQVFFLTTSSGRFNLDGTGRLLDLGCGTGQLTLPLAAHVTDAVGMDPEPDALRGRSHQARAAHVANVAWVARKFGGSSRRFGRFRLVTMGRSFHWMDRERVLRPSQAWSTRTGASDRRREPPRSAHHDLAAGHPGPPTPLPAT